MGGGIRYNPPKEVNCMDEIKLISPTLEYGEDIMAFRREILESNDGENSFAGCGSLRGCTSIEEWLEVLNQYEQGVDGKVPSNTYLAIRLSDNRIVGIIDFRHHINHPILGLWGGHIGYSVRPSERGQGYAKEMLRQDLEICRAFGLDKVLVTCARDNIASEKTILANGGVFEREVPVDGDFIKRYWIAL